ncbi:hypothetical protein HDU76_004391 [Blyttiomyces sp. JEL0837]|nr:hypothetical protein HDU76_004391 [Blyttiomyces sp. JEL0837]
MDDIFTQLPSDKSLAAVSACVCNPHNIPTYPKNWIPANCAHTHEGARRSGKPLPVADTATSDLGYPRYFNSGLFLFKPNKPDYEKMISDLKLRGSDLAAMAFPDQDYLNAFYKDFVMLPYKYNALKTLSRFHQDLWRDDEVCNVHYILEKPWDAGRDGEFSKEEGRYQKVNSWWWNVFDGRRPFESK